MRQADVIVVGAGPAGLTLAGDLARLGRTVTVLERWPTINPASRAFVVMPRTMEVLDSRGIAEHLLAIGRRAASVNLFGDATVELSRVDSRYAFGLITPQTNVDAALEEYARTSGADIVRGTEVIGFEQDAEGVSVQAQPKGGGARSQWRARYLVGADGAHSTVRSLLGVDFPGKSVLHSVVLADIRLERGPEERVLTLGNTPRVFGFLVPYAEQGWYRTLVWDRQHQVADDVPVEDEEIERVLAEAMGRDLGVAEIRWRSRFHCDERQVAEYRHDRVLLVGDAAHVHSPAGGQGMNTGIQDAVNLAWKLDLALGGAPEVVLDSYQRERHPIGRRVLMQSGAMLRAVTLEPRAARWLRDRVVPRVLDFAPLGERIAGSFAGTTLRYARPRGSHRLVGTRAAQVPLREGRLSEILRRPGFVLVREQHAPPLAEDVLEAASAGSSAAGGVQQVQRTDAGPALLVRPDGYVAWAGASAASAERGDWRDALAAWTGGRSRVAGATAAA